MSARLVLLLLPFEGVYALPGADSPRHTYDC